MIANGERWSGYKIIDLVCQSWQMRKGGNIYKYFELPTQKVKLSRQKTKQSLVARDLQALNLYLKQMDYWTLTFKTSPVSPIALDFF